MIRRRRPRVGVPTIVRQYPPQSSVGRIWTHGLAAVSEMATVTIGEPRRRRAWPRRPAVWLCDGHQGRLPVEEPVVAHLHEAAWADPALRPLFEPEFVAQYEAPSAEAARAARVILTVSESSKGQIVSAYGVDPTRVVVAHNGLDHDVYRPGRPGAADLIAGAGGDPNRPYVLFVSTLHPRKNLVALREAMAKLAAGGLPHELVVVAGPSPDRSDQDELRAAAAAPIRPGGGAVVNLAGVSDHEMAALMGGAAAFCLPSLMEGFGMAVAEAMACGAPVVVSDRGALPEVVGEAGVVCSPDADSVAAALEPILSDAEVAASMRRASIERAQRFSWAAMGARWREAVEMALGG